MTNKIGNGSIPLRIGRLIDTTVYGGPYKQVPEFFWGVKMAEEINHPHMVDIPTRDFSVPEVSVLKAGIVKALMAMINEEDVYAGCMGGIGRTGIFLAALAKVQIEYRKAKHRPGRGEDPVLYVRKHFIPHAVETAQQEKYIADLDVSDIVEWLDSTQRAMGLGGLTPAKQTFRDAINATENGKAWEGKKVEPWIAEEDKIENPAFDRYEAEWKSKRDSRNIDWMDAPDADSASEYTPEHDGRMDDLYERMELAEGNIVSLETYHDINNARTASVMNRNTSLIGLLMLCEKRLEKVENALTNASWFDRLVARFK
jgi:hypothetical protein